MTFICLLFLSPILAEPLIDWDARSIWFFHAKMIYVAGSINQSAGWQHPSVGFSHPDYPILVPALAAQVAQVTGLWNEYLPKIALFFMLVPAIAWLFTFARRSFSFVILLLCIPFCFYPWIWNGYMDGLLAVYFSMALLLLGRYIRSSRPIDLVSSVCCFIALSYFKNEGALAALAGLASITLTLLWMKKTNSIKKFFSINWKYLIAVAIVLLPFVLWIFYKQQWNLTNDLSIGTKESFLRIYTRLMDGSYQRILHDVYQQVNGAVLLLGLLLFTSAAWKTKISRESLPALVAAGIYCLGIILIYLLTPNNLVWQLNTSVSRTLLCVNGGIFIGCYYLLNEIENRKKPNNDNNTHEIRSL
jgi:hypothetical protein